MRSPIIALFALGAAARAAVPPAYFPLEPGRSWTYRPGGKPGLEIVVCILEKAGDVCILDLAGTEVRIRGSADEIDIEVPGEGFVPYYRFGEKAFLHRDLRGCDDGRTLLAAGEESVETPVGRFDACLRLDYEDWVCADAGRISEWWAPGVGLVRWTEQSIAGPRSWMLADVVPPPGGGPFLRGDANADGIVAIADPIFILDYLFASGSAPRCLDAADTDDNGILDLADPIFILDYLFAGGPAPPPPGPQAAGYDGTPDDPFPCGDPLPPICRSGRESTLPGVSFDLRGVPAR